MKSSQRLAIRLACWREREREREGRVGGASSTVALCTYDDIKRVDPLILYSLVPSLPLNPECEHHYIGGRAWYLFSHEHKASEDSEQKGNFV